MRLQRIPFIRPAQHPMDNALASTTIRIARTSPTARAALPVTRATDGVGRSA